MINDDQRTRKCQRVQKKPWGVWTRPTSIAIPKTTPPSEHPSRWHPKGLVEDHIDPPTNPSQSLLRRSLVRTQPGVGFPPTNLKHSGPRCFGVFVPPVVTSVWSHRQCTPSDSAAIAPWARPQPAEASGAVSRAPAAPVPGRAASCSSSGRADREQLGGMNYGIRMTDRT